MAPELKKNNFKSSCLPLGIIMALALLLRIWIARLLPCYVFDEMVSAATAEKPLAQIWSYAKFDMYPPLYAYCLHFWFKLFGSSEVTGHSFSILLSILTVVALYFLAKKVFASSLAGLAAAALFAGSPFFAFYGVIARMYVMLFLFSCLSFLFFWKLIESRGRAAVRNGIFYALFTLIVLYTHLTAGLVVIVELVCLFYLWQKKFMGIKEILHKFLAPFIFLSIAYSPWLIYFLTQRLANLQSNAWYFKTQGAPPFVPLVFYDSLNYLSLTHNYWLDLLAFSLIAIFSFSAFGSIKLIKGGWKIQGRFSAGHFFALAIFFLSFIFLFLAKLFVLRYAIIPAIGLFLILGDGFSRARWEAKAAGVTIFVCLIVLSGGVFLTAPLINNWPAAAAYISDNERSGDKIVTVLYSSLLPLNRYYRGSLPADAPLPPKFQENDLLRAVTRTNIYPTTDESDISQLTGFIGTSQRIFLVVTDGEGAFPLSGKITEDWLFAQGFRQVGEWQGSKGELFSVRLLEKAGEK